MAKPPLVTESKLGGTIFIYTVIRYVSVSANFGIFSVVGLNGTSVEA